MIRFISLSLMRDGFYMHFIAWSFGLLLNIAGFAANAQTSFDSISFQAAINGPDGKALANGRYDLTFRFYSVLTGGTALATSSVPNVPVTGGISSTLIPADTSWFTGGQLRYLGFSVNGGTEYTPRVSIAAVPYALSSHEVSQSAITRGPQLSQHRLLLGSELKGDSNLVLQIADANTPKARVILQGVHSQGNAFADVYLNPAGGNVYTGPHCIIGSDSPGHSFTSIGIVGTDTEVQAVRSSGSAWGHVIINKDGGNVGIGTDNVTKKLTVAGEAQVTVLTITGGSDVAEPVSVTSTAGVEKAIPGMVMVIDREHDGRFMPCSAEYDKAVAGVLSGANGVRPGMVLSADGEKHVGANEGTLPMAMTGRVWVLCDATTKPIHRGDSLTTSKTPGHAMAVLDDLKAPRAVIGKAMTELKQGKGFALVLINLQ